MKNKIALIATLTAVVLSSCRKDRYCECVTISLYTNSGSSSFIRKDKYEKVTKKQIETLCVSYKEQYSYGSTTVTCSIK